MKTFLGLLSVAATLAVPTILAADTYKCKIVPKTNTYWIPQDLVINYNPDTAEVSITDHIIKEYKGGKHKGELKVDNKKRTGFKWSLRGIKNSKNQFAPEMSFTASYIKRRDIMTVSVVPQGFADVFFGEGKCQITK
jgi:hypothetical protein